MSSLILATSLAAGPQPRDRCRTLAEQVAAPLRAAGRGWTTHVQDDEVWVGSVGRPGGGNDRVHAWSAGGLTVVTEGYLARQRNPGRPENDAALVAEAYQAGGPPAVERLDGSFLIVVVDSRARRVILWTDRPATRPCFWAALDGVLVVAPELKCFRELLGARPGAAPAADLAPGSLAAMAMNGALLDEHTYYRAVQLVGPARRIAARPGGLEVVRYWQRTFEAAPRPPSADEVADRICEATARHLAPFERPILALSGGLDSRLILAACRRNGRALPTITCGFDEVDTPGSDYQIGRTVAEQAGFPHRLRRLDTEQLPQSAERVVYRTDGLTGHLGNHTESDALARELASEHDALVRGDEMFGWAESVSSPAQALRRVGVNVGKRQLLLRFLLRREVADAVLADYRAQWRQLLASISPAAAPNDLKDILYWRTRLPRLLVSQTPVFRAHLELVSPLLDAEVVDLVRGCTAAQRERKRRVAECARAAFSPEFSVPLNSVHNRTSWRTRLREMGPVQRFLIETLLEPLPAFDEWFDRTAIRSWLAAATAEGRDAPWPADSSWMRRGLARAQAFLLRPAFKERVVLNLVTLKLWFKLFA